MNFTKQELLQHYLNLYNDQSRLNFVKLALKKYRFENYKISNNNAEQIINNNDYIINNYHVRNILNNIVEKNYCSVSDFVNIFNNLTIEQISYIGI
jgi:hypothetical protein